MIEAFFVVFVIFVAYVIYIIVIEPNKAAARAAALKPKSKQPVTAKKSKATKPVAKVSEKPAKKAPATKASTAQASAAATGQAATVLRNPKTGETANVPNNYRFAKRWLKEALIEEGLLDKIYKTNELDDTANNKIKKAINKLATMKKYQG